MKDYLSGIITDMVEICLEYIDEKAEKIYIMTAKIIYVNTL